ncbi:hypothetical protein F4776DRAFT_297903 [Hypoxylon sp. NC0597]|nr:hypothetical protein F4776DRAFT_297903 [Hypoxylon sp. NC0597]
MAHSPLLRTSTRVMLDKKSIALVNYELALEGASANVQQPTEKENFDDSRWTDLRKAHENRKTRENNRQASEDDYFARIGKGKKLRSTEFRSPHLIELFQAWEKIVPAKKSRAVERAVQKTGISEWRPPPLSECLAFEQCVSPDLPSGRVHVADTGVLDRRLLHKALSPQFVPKPHFKMERKRLVARSAEFAAFVAQQASSKRSLIPRPEDETSDEGVLSPEEVKKEDDDSDSDSDDLEEPEPGSRKRKRGGKTKRKKGRRRPSKFVKLYDSKVHDRAHLRAQATNWFSLIQQRLPRVEVPPMELVAEHTSKSKGTPMDINVDEDPKVQEARIYGTTLPIHFSQELTSEGEGQLPTAEEAAQYRDWRRRARPFFNDRDRYMQNRVYCEKAHDRDLLKATQTLLGFWARLRVMLGAD